MLLLLGCDKEQQAKQVKEPSLGSGLEICDSSCEEMIKKNEEMTKKIEAIFRAGRHPIQDTGFRKIFDAENEEGKKKLWKAIDKAMVKVKKEEHRKTLEAKYEEIFKKPAPHWENNSFIGPANPLDRAIRLNFPYLTREEGIELKSEDEKIRDEYKKKFGTDITNFELSIARVDFMDFHTLTRIIAARTTAGIFAKSKEGGYERLELKLDMSEWLDLISALYKCCREPEYGELEQQELTYLSLVYDTAPWLKIYSLDNDIILERPISIPKSIYDRYMLNWSKIPKAMEDIKTKIEKRGKRVKCLRSNNCAYYILDKDYKIHWKENSWRSK
jgi:hypothetical protein